MAQLYGDLVMTGLEVTKPSVKGPSYLVGETKAFAEQKTLAAAAIADTVILGRLHSSACLRKAGSALHNAALGASTTLAVGLKPAGSGTQFTANPTALLAATSTVAAGSNDLVSNTNVGKRLWQVLGLAKDPDCDVWVYATVGGGAATGLVSMELEYLY